MIEPSALMGDRSRLGWWAIVLGLGAAVAYIVVSFAGTFLLGLFVYYATRPIYDRLEHRTGPRSVAAAVSLFAITLPALLVLAYTVVVGVRELGAFAGGGLGDYGTLLRPYVDLTAVAREFEALADSIAADPRRLAESGGLDAVRRVLGIVAAYLGLIANGLLNLFIVLAFAFYLLRDDERLAGWFRTEIAGPGTTTHRYLAAVDRDVGTIYFGNILTALAVGVVAAITYSALDYVAPAGLSIPFPTLLGLLTGIASLIPIVGMKLIYVPMALYIGAGAAIDDPSSLWFALAFFLVAFVVVDTVPELVLRPYVSGRDLHVGLVMFAYIIGPLLFGWYGLFLVPLLLVLVIHVARIVLPDLLRGDEVTPRATAANPLTEPVDGHPPVPVGSGDPSDGADDAPESDGHGRTGTGNADDVD